MHTAAGMELARVLRFGDNANYSAADSVQEVLRGGNFVRPPAVTD
jgi:hypothetical protein